MYLLKKNNIEKEVDSEEACNQLINDGFKLINLESKEDKKKKVTKKLG
jgi:hypothetical protein